MALVSSVEQQRADPTEERNTQLAIEMDELRLTRVTIAH